MNQLKLTVPTYFPGDAKPRIQPQEGCGASAGEQQHPRPQDGDYFGEPQVPVLVCEAAGVRIVLGSHDRTDSAKPDVQIERRANGWVIFLHPIGGSDPSGYVYFLDDGRSFLVRESGVGATDAIEVLQRPPVEVDVRSD